MNAETNRTTDEKPLAEQLHTALKGCSYVRGYDLSVMELPHAVVLGGTVNTFFHKQMAQETAVAFLKPKMQQGLMLMLKNDIVVSERRRLSEVE